MQKKKNLITLICAISCALNAHNSIPLTLDTVQEESVSQRPLVASYKAHLSATEHAVGQETARLLPHVSTKASGNLAHNSTYSDAHYDIALHGTQLIFAPGGPLTGRSIAQKNVTKAQHELTRATQQARHDVTQAFFAAWSLQEQLPEAVASDQSARITADAATAQHDIQLSTRPKREKEYSTAAQLTAKSHSLKESCRNAFRILASYLNKEDVSDAHLVHTMGTLPTLADSTIYTKLALRHRKELASSDTNIALYDEKATQALASSYLPTASLHGQIGQSGYKTSHTSSTSIGASITLPLFDGMRGKKKADEYRACALKATFDKQELTGKIRREVSSAYTTYQTACNTHTAARARARAEHEAWLNARSLKDVGALSLQAYATAARTYRAAHAHSAKTYAAAAQALDTLAFTCGYPSEPSLYIKE